MPLIKLGYLLIRTVSKPVANILKQQTKSHPAFRSACLRLAQAYHRSDIKLSRRLSSAPSSSAATATVRPLDEQKAIELGANFLGEALVFLVAGILLISDSSISVQKEQARRQAIEDRFNQIFKELEEIKGQSSQGDGPNKEQNRN